MSNVCKAWEYYGNCNSLRLKQPPSSYHIGKDAHYRESGNFCGHRNVNVPRRQHPNPNTLRDAPTVRRGKTRAQKCVNDSCIIPQPHTRGCPMSVKLGCCDKIKPQLSTILLNNMRDAINRKAWIKEKHLYVFYVSPSLNHIGGCSLTVRNEGTCTTSYDEVSRISNHPPYLMGLKCLNGMDSSCFFLNCLVY